MRHHVRDSDHLLRTDNRAGTLDTSSSGGLGELPEDLDRAGGHGLGGVHEGEDGDPEALDREHEGSGYQGVALLPDEVDGGDGPGGADGGHPLGLELLEEASDGLKGGPAHGVGAVEHVAGDPGPPVGRAVEHGRGGLAEEDEVVPVEEAAEGFGDGEAEVVGVGVEALGDLLVGGGEEGGEEVGGEGGEEGEGGGGDVGVGEVEVGAEGGEGGVPEVRGEAGDGAEEVERELLADGGGGGGEDLVDGGLGHGGHVAAGGGLLEGLEEGAGLAEGVARPEVRLDLGDQDVHGFFGFRFDLIWGGREGGSVYLLH